MSLTLSKRNIIINPIPGSQRTTTAERRIAVHYYKHEHLWLFPFDLPTTNTATNYCSSVWAGGGNRELFIQEKKIILWGNHVSL